MPAKSIVGVWSYVLIPNSFLNTNLINVESVSNKTLVNSNWKVNYNWHNLLVKNFHFNYWENLICTGSVVFHLYLQKIWNFRLTLTDSAPGLSYIEVSVPSPLKTRGGVNNSAPLDLKPQCRSSCPSHHQTESKEHNLCCASMESVPTFISLIPNSLSVCHGNCIVAPIESLFNQFLANDPVSLSFPNQKIWWHQLLWTRLWAVSTKDDPAPRPNRRSSRTMR